MFVAAKGGKLVGVGWVLFALLTSWIGLNQTLFSIKNLSFYIFFFLANRTGSETSQKLLNQSPPQKMFQLARYLFILMSSAIICIHIGNSQLPISLKITTASLIRNTLAIILTNSLKQGLNFLLVVVVVVVVVIVVVVVVVVSSSSSS